MQFQVGDKVFHPTHGVGHIATISKKRLVGEKTHLYYQVVTDKSTVWVPAEALATIGLRQLAAKQDLAQYRSVLKSRPVALDDDHARRHLVLASRLRRASFQVMCEVVRDLSARGWSKSLTQSDTNCLRRARDELYQEWAVADGVSIAEAGREIDSLLLKARQAHTS